MNKFNMPIKGGLIMKLFKKQKHVEEPESNYEYWKDPRLDNEGTYDFLVEELPRDTAKWHWYHQKCHSCGKYHRLNFVAVHHFYCWDGWDSMDYVECWRCVLRDKIHSLKSKIKKPILLKIQQRKDYKEFLAHFQQNNIPITPELKEITKKVCKQGGKYERV
jgi:hypothetical protein